VSHIATTADSTCRAVQFARRDGRDYIVRVNEHEGAKSATGPKSLQIFDVTDRERPAMVSEISSTPNGPITWAHKGWWDESSGMYFCSVGEKGFRMGGHYTAWDLSAPAEPRFVGRHWLRGQHESEPHAEERAPTMHHPIVDMKNRRAYLGYPWGGDLEVLDIADPAKPKPILHYSIAPTFNKGPHTLLPFFGVKCPDFAPGKGDVRDFILFVNEANNAKPESREVRTMLYVLDVTAWEHPMIVQTWRLPDAPYAATGGRFGSHQFAETRDGELYSLQDNANLLFVAYFNAGLRILDLSDPFRVREVGSYVPAITERTFSTFGHRVIQTNDVDLDRRGLAYLTDRAGTGLHVVEFDRTA
jgi:LVIVD repeat-containing protein